MLISNHRLPFLRKITLPCFLLSIGLFIGYSAINWLLTIKLNLFDPGYLAFDFFIPIVIGGGFVLFFLRRQVRMSTLPEKSRSVILYISAIVLVMPAAIFQIYVKKSFSKLTYLNDPADIYKHSISEYYSIKNAYTQKTNTGLYIVQSAVDRGNEIAVSCFFVCPLLTDTTNSSLDNNIWIGIRFWNKFSNRVFDDKAVQKQLIQSFIDATVENYKVGYNYPTSYLQRQTSPLDKSDFLQAISESGLHFNADKVIILSVADGNFETRTNNSGEVSLIGLGIANLFFISLGLLVKEKRNFKKTANTD